MDEALRAAREGGGPAVVVCFARDAPAGDARRSLDRSAQLLAEGASEAAPGADGPADGGAAASAGLPRQCVHYFRHFCVDYAGMGVRACRARVLRCRQLTPACPNSRSRVLAAAP